MFFANPVPRPAHADTNGNALMLKQICSVNLMGMVKPLVWGHPKIKGFEL